MRQALLAESPLWRTEAGEASRALDAGRGQIVPDGDSKAQESALACIGPFQGSVLHFILLGGNPQNWGET